MSVKKFLKSIKFPGLDAVYEVPVTSVNGMTGDVEVESGGVTSWNDLTDKPFWKEVESVEIFPETASTRVLPASDGTFKPIFENEEVSHIPSDGESVTVRFNGTEYKCLAVFDGEAAIFGNIPLLGVEDHPYSIDVPLFDGTKTGSCWRKF